MNTKLYKIFSVALAGLIIFSACDKDEGTVNGDIVGTWSMVGLSGDVHPYSSCTGWPAC